MFTSSCQTAQAPQIRPELELLITCGRTLSSADRRQQIDMLIGAGLDWTYVLKAAAKHRMVPLLYQGLHQVEDAGIPTDVAAYLQRSCQVNTLKNLFLDSQLEEIMAGYRAESIPVLPYKGPGLAKMVYGSLAQRQFSDLDLLVRPQDFDAAKVVLQQKGFKLLKDLGWEAHFVSFDQPVTVDLHRSILPDFFGVPSNILDPTETHLSPEDLLLLLSIQLGKDCCHWKVCLGQICDIAMLLRQYPDLDFAKVSSRAKRFGCDRFLTVALILVRDFLAEPLPNAIQSEMKARPLESELAQWVQQKIQSDTDHPEMVPEDAGFWYFFSGYNHWFYWQVRERPREKILYCIYWIRELMRMSFCPNKADRAIVSLPFYLDFLYVPIHLIRLLLKYGIR